MLLRDHRNSARELGPSASDAQISAEFSERKYQPSVSRRRRRWIPMPFGKCQLTLPQVLFVDPDYFFWLRGGVLKGRLAIEAENLAQKACRIRIPRNPLKRSRLNTPSNRKVNSFALGLCRGIASHIRHLTKVTEQIILISPIFEKKIRKRCILAFSQVLSEGVFLKQVGPHDKGSVRRVLQRRQFRVQPGGGCLVLRIHPSQGRYDDGGLG
jgi:hypothetical protein